jgi:hypothetical protein
LRAEPALPGFLASCLPGFLPSSLASCPWLPASLHCISYGILKWLVGVQGTSGEALAPFWPALGCGAGCRVQVQADALDSMIQYVELSRLAGPIDAPPQHGPDVHPPSPLLNGEIGCTEYCSNTPGSSIEQQLSKHLEGSITKIPCAVLGAVQSFLRLNPRCRRESGVFSGG